MGTVQVSDVAVHVTGVLSMAGGHDSRPALLERGLQLLSRPLRMIEGRRRRAATLDALEALDDHMLKDIGLFRPDLPKVTAELYGVGRAQSAPQPPWRRAA